MTSLQGSHTPVRPNRLHGLFFFFFFFFFFLGGRDIHYKNAMKETTSVCEGHPQQKLQATRTT